MEYTNLIDSEVLRFIHAKLGNIFLDILCPVLRTKTTWLPLYVYLAYYLWRKFPLSYMRIIFMAISVAALSDILCAQFLKNIFQRTRPCHLVEYAGWLRQFPYCSQTFSFPSCHAMNHAALATFLYFFIQKGKRFLLVLWVFVISFSQVYIGVHFPSDVIGGMLLGLILGGMLYRLTCKFLHAEDERAKYASS